MAAQDQAPQSPPNVIPFKPAQGQTAEAEITHVVDAVNAQFFVVTVAGQTLIGSFEGPSHELVLRRDRDFRLWLAHRRITTCGPQGGNVKSVSYADLWLTNPRRRQFAGLDLAPDKPEVLPNGYLNLWRGFGATAKQGRWPLMAAHIRDVLANGEEQATLYIFRWLAWALQHPGECAEVVLVFRGAKGTGKRLLGRVLKKIFGIHAVHIADQELLVGRFKGHLEFCLFLFADEAFWAGDRKGENVLKGLITEDLYIEKKRIDAFRWTNRLHIMMAANAEWVVPASADERRFVVNDVADTYAMNGAKKAERDQYFSALIHEMENGGIEAMMHELLSWDLGGWHPRQIIETGALRKQKTLSMSWLERWWNEVLQEGRLPGFIATTADKNYGVAIRRQAPLSSLLKDLEECVPQAKGRIGDKEIRTFLEKAHVGGEPWRHASAKLGWKVLPLSQHRRRWAQHYGWEGWPRDHDGVLRYDPHIWNADHDEHWQIDTQ